jgi:hypothetical protein
MPGLTQGLRPGLTHGSRAALRTTDNQHFLPGSYRCCRILSGSVTCHDPGMTLIDSVPRWLSLEGAVNARSVVPGVLLRSDNLQSLTERDVRTLVEDEGVQTVIDLRTEVEISLEGPSPMTRAPGVRIEHRSLYPDSGGNTDVELDALRPWRALRAEDHQEETLVVQAYLNYLRHRPDSIVGSLRTIAR